MLKLISKYISFNENYIFASVIYFGLGLMLYAIVPNSEITLNQVSFAQSGCGGEADCPGSQQCINGECTDAPCGPNATCGKDEQCCNGKCISKKDKCCPEGHSCKESEECCKDGCKKEGQECCGNGKPGNCCNCETPSKPINCPTVQK